MFAITPPGGAEWIIIGFIFVLLFGAKKLPELGGSVGKSIRNFKKGIEEGRDEDAGATGPAIQAETTPAEPTPAEPTPAKSTATGPDH